ncbi:MAG: hypothetical protein MET45_30505, partial [Nostoc sp. LLA-1]|nr:hypothetical protein [Cyanocohniella sp. LLY]
MIQRRDSLKYLFFSFVGFSTVNIISPAYVSNKKLPKHNQAQLLIQKGQQLFDNGQAAAALKVWNEATKIYRQIHYEDGVIGSLINQNFALQALGLNRRACSTLLQALKLDREPEICTIQTEQSTESTKKLLTATIHQQTFTPLNLLAWHNLGDVLRLIGKLNESKLILINLLLIVENSQPHNNSKILLSLGNTEKSIYQQVKDKYKLIEEPAFKKEASEFIHNKALESLKIYQQINNSSTFPKEVQLQSQLQRLNLLLDFREWLTAEIKS